jgi:hypothetical protein
MYPFARSSAISIAAPAPAPATLWSDFYDLVTSPAKLEEMVARLPSSQASTPGQLAASVLAPATVTTAVPLDSAIQHDVPSPARLESPTPEQHTHTQTSLSADKL